MKKVYFEKTKIFDFFVVVIDILLSKACFVLFFIKKIEMTD